MAFLLRFAAFHGLSRDELLDLLTEARRVASLKHPNLVPVFDVGRHEDQLFVVSEFVEGQTLADVIEANTLTHAERITISRRDDMGYRCESVTLALVRRTIATATPVKQHPDARKSLNVATINDVSSVGLRLNTIRSWVWIRTR